MKRKTRGWVRQNIKRFGWAVKEAKYKVTDKRPPPITDNVLPVEGIRTPHEALIGVSEY